MSPPHPGLPASPTYREGLVGNSFLLAQGFGDPRAPGHKTSQRDISLSVLCLCMLVGTCLTNEIF